jgi:hypothetical protein
VAEGAVVSNVDDEERPDSAVSDGEPTIVRIASQIVFDKVEGFFLCEALATAEQALVGAGRLQEAAFVASIFDAIEDRLIIGTLPPSR